MKKKILTCVGTRPNFIKITRLGKLFAEYNNIEYKVLHTGQHFDANMSEIFFNQLGISKPDYFFNLTTGISQLAIIAEIIHKAEQVILEYKPDLVMVPGDVNSSMACALVASRHGIPVAHIESGLRSFDKTMPEEVNRILIDDMADLFFVTEESGRKHLLSEGKDESKIVFTGNTMIDSLVSFMPNIEASSIKEELRVESGEYILLTFHRPGNVDDPESLSDLVDVLNKIATYKKAVFPIHPRTVKNLEKFGLDSKLSPNIILTGPQGYIEFLSLIKGAWCVITDSGGVQEETTYLQVPCITIRPNTERPVTVDLGSNTMADNSVETITRILDQIKSGNYKKGEIPPLWDGKSSERIVEACLNYLA
jgi:UDP-N-acetylglucosamine 2-epimerase (non-hydrolysing)